MKTYPAYKASGLEWLGDIPAHWEVKKLKHLTTIVLGKMLTPEDKGGYYHKPYLRAKNVLWEKVDVSDVKEMWFSEQELKKYRLHLYDILISEGGEVGRTGIWRNEIEECYIQNSVHKVTINRDYNPFYFLYLFLVYGKIGHFDAIAERVSIGHLTKEKLTEVFCLVPSLAEQRAIAAYLDHKTRLIDTYIAKKQQQVERWQAYRAALINQAVTKGLNPDAPMKASGIEWLGEIPAHWEAKRLVFVLERLQDGTHFSPKSDLSGDYLYITAKNIKEWGIDLSEVTYVSEEAHTEIYRRCPVRQGDVLYIKDGATAGIAIVNPIAEPFSMLSSVAMLRPKFNQYDSRYLAYHLNAKSFKEYALNSLVGGAMTRFTIEIISRFRLIAPPLHEQRAIIAYLDEQTAKIDTLVAATQRQLERLRAYRAALISEVVTGKIDVRDTETL